jgi:hypothetical protein
MFQVGDAAYRGKLIPACSCMGPRRASMPSRVTCRQVCPRFRNRRRERRRRSVATGRWVDLGAARSRRQHRRECRLRPDALEQPVELWNRGGGYDWHFHAIPNGRKNIHFSGHGFIVGTVKEKGQPDQPLVRRVQLISENTRVLVAETWSDTTATTDSS